MIIHTLDKQISIQAPYAPRHIARFRSMGGKWQDPGWVFPIISSEMVTAYVDEQWGLGEPDTDVFVELDAEHDGQAYWHGYVLAARRARDYAVKLVESTGCNMELPGSGGSVKSPRVNAPAGAKFGLRIPRAFAERYSLLPPAFVPDPEPVPEHGPLDKKFLYNAAVTAAGVRHGTLISCMISAALREANIPLDAWNQLENDIACLQRAQKAIKNA